MSYFCFSLQSVKGPGGIATAVAHPSCYEGLDGAVQASELAHPA